MKLSRMQVERDNQGVTHASPFPSFRALIESNDAYQIEAATSNRGGALLTCSFDAHNLESSPLNELVLLASHEYQLSTALFDFGWGYRDHFSSAPHPVHVIPPGTPFRWIKNGSARVTFLAIDAHSVWDAFGQLEVTDAKHGLWTLAQKGFANPFIYASISAFAENAVLASCPTLLADSFHVTILNALIHQWRRAAPALRTRSAQRMNARSLRQALDYLGHDLAADLSLDGLAAACGITKYHLIRCIKASTGVTPLRYVTMRRIEHAKHLLLKTHWSIERIAAIVGFRDPASFSRAFGRETGMSPSALRRTNAN